MTLSDRDRADITDLVNLHGHLTDAGDFDGLAELFTPDVVYDLTDLGHGTVRGTAELRAAAAAVGAANPVGHHVTNIVITEVDDRSARVRSKGIGVRAGGTAGSVTYDDVVTRNPGGWKIAQRRVAARRAAPGGPREILERLRRAAVEQSAEGMGSLYAVDAVHEFPFTRPGLPSRLVGRDEIMGWITAGWKAFPLRYESYRTIAVHDTADPETVVVEQEARGGGFMLPNIVVLTVRNGQIVHLRDYVNLLAVAAIMGERV